MCSIDRPDSGSRCKPSALEQMPLRLSLYENLLMLLGWSDRHIRRRRNRLALHKLTDAQLRDLGLARSEADERIRRRGN
jgi:uncharacterized protein YjiS (DUF1127 family)